MRRHETTQNSRVRNNAASASIIRNEIYRAGEMAVPPVLGGSDDLYGSEHVVDNDRKTVTLDGWP